MPGVAILNNLSVTSTPRFGQKYPMPNFGFGLKDVSQTAASRKG